jgi:hypothetical protein
LQIVGLAIVTSTPLKYQFEFTQWSREAWHLHNYYGKPEDASICVIQTFHPIAERISVLKDSMGRNISLKHNLFVPGVELDSEPLFANGQTCVDLCNQAVIKMQGLRVPVLLLASPICHLGAEGRGQRLGAAP